MPNIDLIPIRYPDGDNPYNYVYDKQPIQDVADRVSLVNDAVDINTTIIQNAGGTAGDLANRLNQSMNQDGSLISSAIDTALHKISEHTDDGTYVRMELLERQKLSLIQELATNLSLNVATTNIGTVVWPQSSNTVYVKPSATVTWRVDSAGNVYADTVAPLNNAPNRQYDITPITTDNINFTTTSIATAYQTGSLRVFINGIRMSKTATIDGYTFTETSPSAGTFALNTVLTSGYVIRIDFDQPIS
jgi:hypothetical protein